jgi:hypothetical protein
MNREISRTPEQEAAAAANMELYRKNAEARNKKLNEILEAPAKAEAEERAKIMEDAKFRDVEQAWQARRKERDAKRQEAVEEELGGEQKVA